MKMKCSVCVALMIVCVGLSEAAVVSWDGYSPDIADLGGNVNSTPNNWDTVDSIWGTTDEVVSAVGGQASFKAAIGILPGQRRIAQVNAGSDQIFVGGNENATADPPPMSPYTTLVGFDTSAFGVDEVLTEMSIELRTRPTGDTLSLRWFVEAGGSTYVSGVVDSMTGAEYKILTLSDATAIEWFAFDKDANIGSAVGASVGTLSLTDVDYVGYYTSSSFTNNANWHGAFVKTFSATAVSPFSAGDPNPADGATGVDAVPTLSWAPGVDPANPTVPNPAITGYYLWISSPYDPNNPPAGPDWQDPGVQTIEVDLSASRTVTLQMDSVYFWTVDESIGAAHARDWDNIITGSVWSFETITSAPVVEAGSSVVTWLKGATATVDLNGSVTDATGDLTSITWSALVSPPDAIVDIANPSQALTTVTLDTTGHYELQLTATDAVNPEESDVMVIDVYADACEAARNNPNGYTGSAYDFNADCRVDFADLALFAVDWLQDGSLTEDVLYEP
ncbi:MAG: PKD domain-containing protein [Planctomycetota bacterium]